MSWPQALLLLAIPAAILIWVSLWIIRGGNKDDKTLTWLLLLLAADLMLLPMACSALLGRFNQELLLFLEMPFLFGAMTLVLTNPPALSSAWHTRRPALAGLALAYALLAALMALGQGLPMLVIPLFPFVIAAAWLLVRRLASSLVFGLGLLVLALLALEASGALSSRAITAINWRGDPSFFGVIGIGLAFLFQALLIQRALNGTARRARGAAPAYLALAALLLLAVAAVEVRHGVLVKATGRAFEDHLPFAVVVLAFVTAVVLIAALPRWRKLAGAAYLVLAPILILSAYTSGWAFDPQQITQGRAAQITQALERYHAQNGAYPDALGELTPGYLPVLLGPLTGRDQVWCYQGGAGFYRLGYVWYQRYFGPTFPSPHVEIKVFSSAGQPPPGRWVCDQEYERFKLSLGF